MNQDREESPHRLCEGACYLFGFPWDILGDTVEHASELSHMRVKEAEEFIYQLPAVTGPRATQSYNLLSSAICPCGVSSGSQQKTVIAVPSAVCAKRKSVAVASIPRIG